MSKFKEENGAVAIFESSFIFPICFFALFILLFFSLHLFNKLNRGALIRRNLAEETTSLYFENPEEAELANKIQANFSKVGLFFKSLEIEDNLSIRGFSPYRFFKMEDNKQYKSLRRGRRSSSANQLWFMQAIIGFVDDSAN